VSFVIRHWLFVVGRWSLAADIGVRQKRQAASLAYYDD
jgi:hypothetical protein